MAKEQKKAEPETAVGVEEETTPEASAASEEKEKPSETPSEGETPKEETEASAEADELLASPDFSEKTKERIKTLSARVRELEAERKERQAREGLWRTMTLPAGISQPPVYDELGRQVDTGAMALQEVRQLVIEQQEKEAFSAYPQLNPKAENYDKDFDYLVEGVLTSAWSRGEKLSFKEAADKVSATIAARAKEAESEGAKKALEEVSEQEKAAFVPSGKPAKAGSNLQELFAKAQKTGKTEDWVAYENAKAEAEGYWAPEEF